MQAIVVICREAQAAMALNLELNKRVGPVAHYCRGRRLAGGGVRQLAEIWLRRQHPECLLHPQTLLFFSESDSLQDDLDETLNAVVRQANPQQFEVRWLELVQEQREAGISTSGN